MRVARREVDTPEVVEDRVDEQLKLHRQARSLEASSVGAGHVVYREGDVSVHPQAVLRHERDAGHGEIASSSARPLRIKAPPSRLRHVGGTLPLVVSTPQKTL